MSWKNLFRNPQEAIVEIEEAYVRFLVPAGDKFNCTTIPVSQSDLSAVLRNNLAKILGEVREASIVTNYQTGIKVLPFPASMDTKDIIEHLQLKREEYFGVKGECEFILKVTANSNKETKEIMVSYILKSFFNRLQQIFQEEGYTLNRVSNVIETMIGAYSQQSHGKKGNLVCLLAIGYLNISMVVLKNGQPVAVRTTLTGSVKEIENRLMSVLKMNKVAVDELLSGKTPADQESIELIQQNERELLSRIAPFFAVIRSLDSEVRSFEILLAMPYIVLPGLPNLLEQNFKAKVLPLDTGNAVLATVDAVKADMNWLTGITAKNILSFTPVRHEFLRFALTPKLAWMFVIFFLLAPLGLAKISILNSENQLSVLKTRFSEIETLYRQSKENLDNFARLESVGAMIAAETSGKRNLLPLIKKISGMVSDELRFERITLNLQLNQLHISGIAIDNETALKLWDTLEKSDEITNARVNFSDKQDKLYPKFIITAELGKK